MPCSPTSPPLETQVVDLPQLGEVVEICPSETLYTIDKFLLVVGYNYIFF